MIELLKLFVYLLLIFTIAKLSTRLWSDSCKYCGGKTKDWSSKFSVCEDCGEKN